jgi:hypothetical protein
MEFYMMYDLYLFVGSRTLPELDDLVQQVPVLADPDLQKRMVQRSPGPHFLRLNLPVEVAATLMQRLESRKASGYMLPSAYRHPTVSIEQAFPTAARVIAELHATKIPDHTLGPVRLVREQPVCWTFGAASEEWIKEDRIPGLLFASIDKLDGHVWQEEEFARLSGESNLPPFQNVKD